MPALQMQAEAATKPSPQESPASSLAVDASSSATASSAPAEEQQKGKAVDPASTIEIKEALEDCEFSTERMGLMKEHEEVLLIRHAAAATPEAGPLFLARAEMLYLFGQVLPRMGMLLESFAKAIALLDSFVEDAPPQFRTPLAMPSAFRTLCCLLCKMDSARKPINIVYLQNAEAWLVERFLQQGLIIERPQEVHKVTEQQMLKTLNFNLNPSTAIDWFTASCGRLNIATKGMFAQQIEEAQGRGHPSMATFTPAVDAKVRFRSGILSISSPSSMSRLGPWRLECSALSSSCAGCFRWMLCVQLTRSTPRGCPSSSVATGVPPCPTLTSPPF
mmetsp:Transcript_60399/g.197671  ORF Transcript_60399/g.197671 Transcript_60399/m.197671 type:complete len:333 (-) Transcript_60399:165-1163(-)